MRFQSGISNRHEVVLTPDIERDQHGRKIRDIPGIIARFVGGELDTSTQGWTEAQEHQVISHILQSPEFGRYRTRDGGQIGPERGAQYGNVTVFELYLASGQELPESWLDLCEQLEWYQRDIATGARHPRGYEPPKDSPAVEVPSSNGRCAYVKESSDGALKRCGSFTRSGELYCSKHAAVLQAVS